jgi:hypothetical protein
LYDMRFHINFLRRHSPRPLLVLPLLPAVSPLVWRAAERPQLLLLLLLLLLPISLSQSPQPLLLLAPLLAAVLLGRVLCD